MAYNMAAKAYETRKVETATQADLTLMLYEGAVKFCNIAVTALEKKDYEKTNMDILNRALGELRDMRDIWKEVMKRARGPQLTLS